MADIRKPQIILYRGFPGSGHYTSSPFVTKIEARLRFAGLRYQTEAGSIRNAPRGKVPYLTITDPDTAISRTLCDSDLIIKDLVETGLVSALNTDLNASHRTYDLALRGLLENRLYFLMSHEKWIENYYDMRDHVLGSLPYPVRVVVGLIIYRKTTQTLYGQGTLRFTPEEIASSRLEIWKELSSLLKVSQASRRNQIFWVLGGDSPTEADAVCFGFIVSALVCTVSPGTRQVVKDLPVLVEYARRIHDHFFPEYTLWE